MTLFRLKTILFCRILVVAFLAFGWFGIAPSSSNNPLLFGRVCLAGENLTPDRNISVILDEPGSPEWKDLWDKARYFVHEQNYLLARAAYSELVASKPNIEEAAWEYCKVLLKLNDFDTASTVIATLLDKQPNNSDYLLVGADLAMHWNHQETAVRYYGRVFEKDPTGDHSDAALLGLANSLEKQGKSLLAFVPLELFSQRHPENSQVLERLAQAAFKLGKRDKARKLYARLIKKTLVDDQSILQAAALFDQHGMEETRNLLLLQYLERYPNYQVFRKELVHYYLENRQFESALKHLQFLADNNSDNEEFLLRAAEVCRINLQRPDKALFFYERYKNKHPQNPQIKKIITTLQSELAKDFLVIVENDGAAQLWKDLALITPNRSAIFLEMVDIFEQKGQADEVLELLVFVYKDSNGDGDIALRIAEHYLLAKNYQLALQYLQDVTGKGRQTKSYHLMRGEAEQHLGLEIAALDSYQKALVFHPHDWALRLKCIKLSGEIGDVRSLQSVFTIGQQLQGRELAPEAVLLYLDLLANNFLFNEYHKIHSWALSHFKETPEITSRLKIQESSVLRKEGKKRSAEQLLRELVNNEQSSDEALFHLAFNAITDKKVDVAESWFQALIERDQNESSSFALTPRGCRLLVLRVKILMEDAAYGEALGLIDSYLDMVGEKQVSSELQIQLDILKVQQCRLNLYDDDIANASLQCRKLLAQKSFDPEVVALSLSIEEKLEKSAGKTDIESLMATAGKHVLSRTLALGGYELEAGKFNSAKRWLTLALQQYPDSIVGRALWSDLMLAKGEVDIAGEYYARLAMQFPNESYFIQKQIEVEVRRGRYDKGLSLLKNDKNIGVDTIESMPQSYSLENEIPDLLSLARLLWGNRQQEQALHVYRKLLAPSVFLQLTDRFRQKQISDPTIVNDSGFWSKMMLLLQSEPDVLAELMQPSFLVQNRGNDVGRIVAELYGKYSWEKLIANEYKARQAVYDRNYYYAEQSYEKLLKEDSTEGMIDLASVYGRIGKYRKEAQIYEAIQKSGIVSPDLNESIERSILLIRPQNIFDAKYEERSGRDGNIDMAKTTIGTSFWFTPSLDKDIRFQYSYNSFESLDTEASTSSNFFYGTATYEFAKAYDLVVGGGAESFSNDSAVGYQYDLRLNGRLDDYVSGYVLFEKRQVYDTIRAIEQQITFQSIETGLTVETPVGLSFGGDIYHRYFNDGNSQNRFHGFSSYTVFKESMHLALRYEYQYLTSDDQSSHLVGGVADNSGDPLYYYSPSNYNQHLMSLHFQQDFLGYEQGVKKGMSYYSIDQAIGLEDNEYLTSTTKFDIFLEMSPHFLLKGNFILSMSNEYEEKGLSLSLHYRW